MTIKKIVILSDLQVPFEDVHVVRNIAKFLGTFKPDQTVTIGDEIDFQTISKWSQGTPEEYSQSLGDDRDRCVELLWELGVSDCKEATTRIVYTTSSCARFHPSYPCRSCASKSL